MRKSAIGWMSACLLGLALAGCSGEGADWKSASAADTTEAYQQFLQQHPQGANADAARTRLKQLQEDHDWQVASSTDTRPAYEQFVAQHADSKWAQEARIRIENFAQGATSGTAPAAPAATPVAATAPTPPAASKSPPKSSAPVVKTNRPTRVARAAAVKTHKAAAAHSHMVQLGAFSSRARAETQWKRLQAKFPTQLKSMEPRYVASTAKASHVIRLQVAVSSAADARGLCAKLKKRSQPCVAISA